MVAVSTIGSTSTAAISSLSMVRFNPFTGKTFEELNLNIDLSLGLQLGAEASADTFLWWLSQSDPSRKSMIDSQLEGIDPIDATLEIKEFISKIELEIDEDLILWGNGAGFSIPIIANYYYLLGMDIPWYFNNVRDVRTIVDFAPEIKAATVFEGTRHMPYFDCLHQIKFVSGTLQHVFKPHSKD